MPGFWRCVEVGTKACLGIVAVSPVVLAAWLATHPIPRECPPSHVVCRWVIPPEAFRPGGELAPPQAMLWPPTMDVSRPPEVIAQVAEPGSAAVLGLALATLAMVTWGRK